MLSPEPQMDMRLYPVSDEHLHPPLTAWSRIWRYLFAVGAGAAAWMVVAASQLSAPLTPAQEQAVGLMLFLDLALGVVTLGFLPLRRRYPLAVACATTVVSVASVASLGSVSLAVASMATWRRRGWVAVAAILNVAVSVVMKLLYHPLFVPGELTLSMTAGGILLSLMFFAATVATGYYVGARRELVASLRERLLTAEREQVLNAQVARDAERTRIAREMHDVLAHRISLVALHAGALTYRQDLTREQIAEAAQTIQTNAQLALAELRQVLGVLRGGPGAGVEQPQPTLAELPALLADAREAGSAVQLDITGLQGQAGPGIGGEPALATLPQTLSRTSLRIVQESLTNARKHAPGEPVHVRLAGAPGKQLEIEVRNRVGVGAAVPLPSAGVGLAGLTERAKLAGGTMEHRAGPDGFFVVRASLPWPR